MIELPVNFVCPHNGGITSMATMMKFVARPCHPYYFYVANLFAHDGPSRGESVRHCIENTDDYYGCSQFAMVNGKKILCPLEQVTIFPEDSITDPWIALATECVRFAKKCGYRHVYWPLKDLPKIEDRSIVFFHVSLWGSQCPLFYIFDLWECSDKLWKKGFCPYDSVAVCTMQSATRRCDICEKCTKYTALIVEYEECGLGK